MGESARSLTQQFTEVLGATDGVVQAVATAEAAADAIAAIASAHESRQLLYSRFPLAQDSGLETELARRGVELIMPETAGAEASSFQVGLTGATAAIAESGTLIVGGQPGAWGLAAVLPWVHIAVLRAEDIYPDLPAAFTAFASRLESGERDWVWITGPSRTADIGHTLVLGAHGPNTLHVLVIGEGE